MEPQKAKRHTSIQSLCYSGVKLDTFQEDLDGKNVALTDGLVSRLFALLKAAVTRKVLEMAKFYHTSLRSRAKFIFNVTMVTNWLETNFANANQIRNGVDGGRGVNKLIAECFPYQTRLKRFWKPTQELTVWSDLNAKKKATRSVVQK